MKKLPSITVRKGQTVILNRESYARVPVKTGGIVRGCKCKVIHNLEMHDGATIDMSKNSFNLPNGMILKGDK